MEQETETRKFDSRGHAPSAFDLEDGRDELNLAEFPLAAIADRVPDNQKTLVFEDRIFDSGKSEMITRRLTISASDKFGLPTPLDDEVILGLIQLTKQNAYIDRKVSFSRYQLIQVLGWRHEGRSYERLEKSLLRWLGVTLYYDKAWWDKDAQRWVDENFHVLDHVTLYDQERRLKKLRSSQSELPLSSFTWNEVVFRSFKSGYLKAIDLNVFRQLQYAAAKRMYRFLDKRFYHKSRWEFDLMEFACEHVGLSRNYDTGQLKRRLRPAITELETVGFLEPLTPEQRYVKICRGEWRVVFVRKAQPVIEVNSMQKKLAAQLSERGVTPSVAAELVQQYPADLIEMQMEVFGRLQKVKDRDSIRNPAGYLVKSIREGYLPPKAAAVKKPAAEKSRPVQIVETVQATDPNQQAIETYLASLSPTELAALETDALTRVDGVLADGYYRSKSGNAGMHAVYRRMVLEREASRLLTSGRKDHLE